LRAKKTSSAESAVVSGSSAVTGGHALSRPGLRPRLTNSDPGVEVGLRVVPDTGLLRPHSALNALLGGHLRFIHGPSTVLPLAEWHRFRQGTPRSGAANGYSTLQSAATVSRQQAATNSKRPAGLTVPRTCDPVPAVSSWSHSSAAAQTPAGGAAAATLPSPPELADGCRLPIGWL
jgi:hypothetical protein